MKRPTSLLSALQYPGRLLSSKSFVFIASAQRSGSTLLKALLAEAPDISHLPEVPFHRYGNGSAWQLKTLSDKPIIVLKKPSWPNELDYPRLPPVREYKLLLLIRHPYEALVSTGKMYEKMDPDLWSKWSYHRMLYDYWLPTYEGILDRGLHLQGNAKIIHYEKLTEVPIETTQSIFSFVGSKRKEGTDTYQKKAEKWTFMTDDGSNKIKSLRVQSGKIERNNEELLHMIQQEPRVLAVLNDFGYNVIK